MAGAFNWNGPTPMGLAAFVQQQGDFGRQRGEDSRLARLVSGAMADPSKRQSNLAEIASFRPDAAFAAQGQFDQQTDRKYAELGKRAAVLAGAPEAMRGQVWAQLRPELEQTFGMQGLPAEVTPEIIQTAQQLAQVYGGAGGVDPKVLSPGAAMVDSSGRVIFQNPAIPNYSVQEYTLPDGSTGWRQIATRGEAPGTAHAVSPGGSVSVGQPTPASYASGANGLPQTPLANTFAQQFPGFRATSTFRDPERNAKAGGVENSFHLTGNAIDGYPQSPQQLAQIEQWAGQNGMEVIKYPGGRIHVEPRPGMAPTSNYAPPAAQSTPASGGFGQTDAQRAEAAAQKVRAEETARRQLGLEYAPAEADAAAEAARKKKEAEALAERNANSDKKAGQAKETLSTLDDVISLLPGATGSRLGAARDAVLAVGGISTEGAQASAQLRLLAAKLIANVPRFEGPQSNIDVQFYREAAGDLANENLPVDTRLAAAERMKEIAQRYAEGGSQPPPDDDEEALIGKYL